MFDIKKIRRDFPALNQKINGYPLAYLDNASTTLTPKPVFEKINQYYKQNRTAYGGVHELSRQITEQFDAVRHLSREFLGARDDKEIIFVKGATEALNLVAETYGQENLRKGDEVLVSLMEHHSNILPWQKLCRGVGAKLQVIPLTSNDEIDFKGMSNLLNKKTKIVSVTHASNALGTINDVKRAAKLTHENGSILVIDGAQAAPHLPVNVQSIDADFYVLSAHKMFGTTGIGVVYGKRELLSNMGPYQVGGKMIHEVTFKGTVYAKPPQRFEAGSPNIAGVIGFGATIEYLNSIDRQGALRHEQSLLDYATEKLSKIKGLNIIGKAPKKISTVSFTMDNIATHDIGTVIDQEGVAIRTGHLCVEPLLMSRNIQGLARVSLAFYNTKNEIDQLIRSIDKVKTILNTKRD